MNSIAAVVNLHTEGETALPSIISAWRAVEAARSHGIDAHLVLVADSPDLPTVRVVERWRARGAAIVSTDVGDLGAARNVAADAVDSTWLAFLDADDLWGEAWLVEAHAMATDGTAKENDVFHPAVNIIFGDHHSLLHHIDSDGPDFRWSRFHLHNAWTALSFVRRDHLLALPYPNNDLANGFGFEDWSWNMAVLDSGGRHRVVRNTCHFIKRTNSDAGPDSEASLLAQSQHSLRTRYPTVSSPERSADHSLPTSSSAGNDTNVDEGTHLVAPIELPPEIFRQIRIAASIEPAVAKTLSSTGPPSSLPQNFNTHNTAGQRALEELWLLRTKVETSEETAQVTIGELCDRSTLLWSLESTERAKVVAEFLLTERQLGRAAGDSTLIAEATAVYSQLASST